MTPIHAFQKSKEKEVYSNLKDIREVRKPNFNIGELVRTAYNKNVFSKGDSKNYSYKLYTKTEILHNTIPSFRLNYLTERYNEITLLPTELSLEENNKDMKKPNLIQNNKLNKWK